MSRQRSDQEDLRRLVWDLDGQGYGAYKRLSGSLWRLGDFELAVERVQADPYAPPSRFVVSVPAGVAALPSELARSATRRRAIEDYLTRQAADRLTTRKHGQDSPFLIDAGRQEVLERSACRVDERGVQLRLGCDLPARGRRVLGRQAARLLTEELPAAVERSLRWPALEPGDAWAFVACVEDAVALREALEGLGLVAFVADGAILPRRSGVDDRPLAVGTIVPLVSPLALRHEVELPNRGRVTGMGIPEGVTLVVGGGFHGKSTLLRALERGVYDHVPGDGRELVVARADATKIRAEDGRRVERVDVSPFVGNLPTGRSTSDFSTDNASGSTSQAASIVEALEVGARVLLVDEDTAATNLMIRDLRMQELVSKDREPLTPFVDLVRPLHREHGISSVFIVGGSGDYFDVADHVLLMDAFRPREVSHEARRIAARWPARGAEAASFPKVRHRVPDPTSVDPRRRGRIKTRARGTDEVQFGTDAIDLSAVAQLVDPGQTLGVALALTRLGEEGFLDARRTLAEALDLLYARIAHDGIDVLRRDYPGDLALPRRFEVAAALNRLRSLRVLHLS
ncbi:MAG: ABC-ATPase domain-containing protein [Actinomycetota bacterium]|nr:ABC-ATPase domain-containing protein [Actinomycetota bacterium]